MAAKRSPIHRVTLEEWKASLQRDPSKDARPKYADGELCRPDDWVDMGDGVPRRVLWAFVAVDVPKTWRAVVVDVRPDPLLSDLRFVRRWQESDRRPSLVLP